MNHNLGRTVIIAALAGIAALTLGACGGAPAVDNFSGVTQLPALVTIPANSPVRQARQSAGTPTQAFLRRSEATSLGPFLISGLPLNPSGSQTIYAADASFKTFTPLLQNLPGLVYQIATRKNTQSLFVADCLGNSTNGGYLPGGLSWLSCNSGGQTEIWSSASAQPTVLPYGGYGVAVAANGRFAVAEPPQTEFAGESVSEFRSGQQTPFLTFNPSIGSAGYMWGGLGLEPQTASIVCYEADGSSPHALLQIPWRSQQVEYTYPVSVPPSRSVPSGASSLIVTSSQIYAALALPYPGNGGDGYVEIFTVGSPQPKLVLTNGISMPLGIAVWKGNLYVANAGPSLASANIAVYGPGQTSPSKVIRLPFVPTALALRNGF